MTILLSVPTGYHLRELVLPLYDLLAQDDAITRVFFLSPAAPWHNKLFPNYHPKFTFIANPDNSQTHTKLFSNIKPGLIVTNTSGLDPVDIPILKAAKTLHIPTCTFIASWDNVWKMERLHRQKNKPQVLADHIIVWNQMMKHHLISIFNELNADNIHVVGAPRFDFFQHTDKIPGRPQLLDYLGLPHKESKLVHFATTELYPMDYVIKSVRQAEKNHTIKHPLSLIASVHPGGNIRYHQAYAKPMDAEVFYSFGRRRTSPHPNFYYNPTLKDIYMHIALFKHADLLINHSSTVALESIAGGTPVINIKYGRRFDWWRWYRSMVYRDFSQHYSDIIASKATTVVANQKQLIGAVNSYLNNPHQHSSKRKALLKKMITNTKGTASLQFLRLFKKISAL